ncbi:MAG: endonuclease [Gammaproteobacteria bacterium CG_4_10_14_0_8_um_filter_38_16]|nr:MAG: endonuclease [Gammaproteobacteria bacterium CG_4_10_14_0_8_um_filter_38_16]PJA04129.1 MAG: endonuclease [Gammaproteobacteria bacterium CG_4_10_14_0_2_um_filter_38_22]PJB10004.1 MAG: endonuclease [Gammaproteobacteria bacterium CG_4_9_14_3_um_filter_38_9]
MKHYVYIIECQNGSYYTGYTTDVARRYEEHKTGVNCKYTRSFPPKKLQAFWVFDHKSDALRIEYKIKLLSKAQKKRLIVTKDLLLCE